MAKLKKSFFCRNCGYESTKWVGRCPACGEWNTFVEEVVTKEPTHPAHRSGRSDNRPIPVREIEHQNFTRIDLGNGEVNRVLGGGLGPGSIILLGGEPGIGNSTLSLQLAMKATDLKKLSVSGEESPHQIKMRAERIGISNDACLVYSETNLENILTQISQQTPDLDPDDPHGYDRLIAGQRLPDQRMRGPAAKICQAEPDLDRHHRTHHQGRHHRRAENSGTHR